MPLLKPTEAAAALGRKPQTLARWRSEGTGPEFVRIQGRVFYQQHVIDALVEANRFTSTSEAQARQRSEVA